MVNFNHGMNGNMPSFGELDCFDPELQKDTIAETARLGRCMTPAQRIQTENRGYHATSRMDSSRALRPKSAGVISDSRNNKCGYNTRPSSSSQRQRPKTASTPLVGNYTMDVVTAFNPYQTSYKHEYYRKDEEEDVNVRPSSHIRLDSEPLRDTTTYGVEYSHKKTTPNQKVWGGGNNPHPSQAFMTWRYPTKEDRSGEPTNHTAETLTNDVYDKVMRGKTKSTYQNDFKGLPPGYMPADIKQSIIQGDWKGNIPYTLDSCTRAAYQQPNQPAPLTNNTSRFGKSGHDRHKLLVGIAPNASQRRATVRSNTTYGRHYNDTAPRVDESAKMHFPTQARTVIKGKGTTELSAMYEEIKRKYFPKYARGGADRVLNGHCNEVPIAVPDSGIPSVANPYGGLDPIPGPNFITTPVPEPICEPLS